MKKLLAILSAAALILTFAACGNKETPTVTTEDTSASVTTSAEETTGTTAESRETDAPVTADTTIATPEVTADTTEAKMTEPTVSETETTTAEATTEAAATEETTTEAVSSATTEVTTEATTEATAEATTEAPAETTAPATPDAGDNAALKVLQAIWNAYPADDKFASFGGDIESAVMDAPGAIKLDAASMDRTLGFPQDAVDKIDAGASLLHMLNANTFTAGAFRIKDGEDAAALAESIRANIQARRWMCGYPDSVRILTVGDTLVTMFGNNTLLDNFVEAAKTAYPDLTVTVNEPVQ